MSGMVEDTSAMASLNAAKQQIRSAMKNKLGALSPEAVKSQSSVVFNTLRNFQPYVDAKRVSVFLSMPTGEIQTDGIVRHALESGKEVFIPYLHKNPLASPNLPARVMDMVRLKDLHDYESLKPDRWGIPSIDPATVHERQRVFGGPDAHHSDQTLLDLILMPGVAFDIDPEAGAIRRLGHGKGFYDYFINRHNQKSVELGKQETPVGRHDQPLDGLILGNGEIKSPPAPK